MSTARSAFTEAIEEHLALKKQNSTLEPAMPLARYDVGDPLDRYPGGPNRATDPNTVLVAEDVMTPADGALLDPLAEPVGAFAGPSPEQAMEAATALETAFGDRPFEPLNGLAPMLSLVEDIEDELEATETPAVDVPSTSADVLRFPGGVGPREDAPVDEPLAEQLPMDTHAFTMPAETPIDAAFAPAGTAAATIAPDAPTGEQPIIVIDTDGPIATSGFDEPAEPSRSSRKKPRFFGLGRKKSSKEQAGDGWFTDGPRDFNWD
jgi:hypothetical protein